MRNEPWVWPEVGGAGTSGAGAVPLRSAQMMGQQKKKSACFILQQNLNNIILNAWNGNTLIKDLTRGLIRSISSNLKN